jgi:hypothetical protein
MGTTTIQIDLQEGFEKDTVQMFIDGQEVYNEQKVQTRYQISHADTIKYETTHASVNIEIYLSEKNIKSTIYIDVRQTPYLGINISTDGKIIFNPSSKPFGYL